MKTRECIKWLWRASHDVRGHILSNSLIGILHVASSLTFVWICKTLVDIVTTGTGSHLTTYILAMVGCQLLQVTLTALEQRISSHSDILLKNKLRYLLFTRLMESRFPRLTFLSCGRVRPCRTTRLLQAPHCPMVCITSLHTTATRTSFISMLTRSLKIVATATPKKTFKEGKKK